MSTTKVRATTHLIVRKNGVLCTFCADVLPVHPGESGTPLGTFVIALEALAKRHPAKPHAKVGPEAEGDTDAQDCPATLAEMVETVKALAICGADNAPVDTGLYFSTTHPALLLKLEATLLWHFSEEERAVLHEALGKLVPADPDSEPIDPWEFS